LPSFQPFPDTQRWALPTPRLEARPGLSSLPGDSSELPPGAVPWSGNADDEPLEDRSSREQLSSEWADQQEVEPQAGASSQPLRQSYLGLQLHTRSLITHDEQGMVVFDQHALTERILYDQLRQKTENRSL